MTPQPIQDAIRYFADFENCQRAMIEMRWPDGGVRCPYCDSEKVVYLPSGRVWKCYTNHPRRKFSLKVGTIFEDSAIGLDKWFTTMWLIANCKDGVSSYEISRDIGVTQKTAWFMLQRIRLAMQTGTFEKLSGEVEADESLLVAALATCTSTRRPRLRARAGPEKKSSWACWNAKPERFA